MSDAVMEQDAEVQLWRELLEPDGQALVELASSIDLRSPAALARLREGRSQEFVAAAIELATAREKARAKFPHKPDIIADVQGIEQATSALVAEHKAKRFAAAAHDGPARHPRIHDLCCGVGGDAMSLARIAEVHAFEKRPLRAWMTQHNAGCMTHVADVTTLPLQEIDLFHIDPARRREAEGGARRHQFHDYKPGPDFLAALLERCPNGAIKLGPGVDFDALPLTPRSEIEVINEHGTLTQAVLWSGSLAHHPGLRTATKLPENVSFTARSIGEIPVADPQRFLLAIDAALERADLLGAFCADRALAAIHPQLGLLTSDEPLRDAWVTPFELLEVMPWRPRKVRQWLDERGAGVIEVKTRGKAVEPDQIQRSLRGRDDHCFTLFILRVDRKLTTYITRRV